MALKPVTVSQLNEYISRVLTTDPLLGNVTVTGEISNLKFHSSGHVYFSVNDDFSKINCFFPASYVRNLNYELGNGLEVIINGYINVYKKGGTYTLFVRNISVAGEGNLAAAFQLMKEKLEREGLFDPRYKKDIPAFPYKVGVVTSPTGAAVEDIKKIITGRNSLVDIIIFPVLVQGDAAGRDIADTVRMINSDPRFSDIDVLIVGRGGGSQEDLWAFNEEVVARAIFESSIPVISAVGHETDFSISDFVADKRAETPTAAAEMAVPDLEIIRNKLETFKSSLLADLSAKVRYDRLVSDGLLNSMKDALVHRAESLKNEVERIKLILDSNNPLNILEKGYSILETEEGKTVSSVNELSKGQSYRLRMKDGTAILVSTAIERDQ